ncbi:hypothetical protein DINM_002854 [Dirofilaria immitis]|nr:hypothetical protein [Dirofilaria immitis]
MRRNLGADLFPTLYTKSYVHSSVMNLPEKRMKEAVDALIDDIDQSYLRGIHKKMFICSSDCYDKSVNRDIVETCVERCNQPVKNATNILQQELDDLQAQLNRCAMTCFDRATQKFGPDPAHYTEMENKEFDKQLLEKFCGTLKYSFQLCMFLCRRPYQIAAEDPETIN